MAEAAELSFDGALADARGAMTRRLRRMSAEARLAALAIELPAAMPPAGDYVAARRAGDLLYLSGHGPVLPDGRMTVGRVGSELTLEQARDAARRTGLSLLATLRGAGQS